MKVHRLFLSVMMFFTALIGMAATTDASAQFIDKATRDARREEEIKKTQETFSWWPTDAKPAPVKDEKGGYWWWPQKPGTVQNLWGNRGYIYVYKLIYDYKDQEEKAKEEPTPIAKIETKASLLVKKIIKNVKIYFDYNKAALRDDHHPILEKAVKSLAANPNASILITGNCDARGSDEYNMKLGKKRGDTVKKYMLENGITEDRIKIVSRGKLDALAPIKDVIGMQKDRNAQFMIAEVEEVNIPAEQVPPKGAQLEVSDTSAGNKYVMEEKEDVESAPNVSTREYTIKEGDSLWKIAQHELGNGNRWQYLFELNKDRIKNASKLKKGTVIIIPIE
jgi:outer membrane protein OmpA-like peptidoglycan-associated protein